MIICYSGGGEQNAPQLELDEEIWFEKERNDKDNDEKELMDDGRYADLRRNDDADIVQQGWWQQRAEAGVARSDGWEGERRGMVRRLWSVGYGQGGR